MRAAIKIWPALAGIVCICVLACTHLPSQADVTPELPDPVLDTLRYLALGDSYTIGHAVPEQDRFPVQLAVRLSQSGLPIHPPHIIARTGWTSGRLLEELRTKPVQGRYDLVSLLIGVNNQYQSLSLDAYAPEFRRLLDSAVVYANNRPERVFVLSIPDYAFTPFGQNRPNPALISQQIDQFNAVNRSLTLERGIAYFDITPISRRGLSEPALVAGDGLHPSGEMYRRWVGEMWEAVAQLLRE